MFRAGRAFKKGTVREHHLEERFSAKSWHLVSLVFYISISLFGAEVEVYKRSLHNTDYTGTHYNFKLRAASFLSLTNLGVTSMSHHT